MTSRGQLASQDSSPYPNRNRILRYNATKQENMQKKKDQNQKQKALRAVPQTMLSYDRCETPRERINGDMKTVI